MPYKVKLETFEGPLDLLLFLIKKNEVDIYDIPIANITRQFLEYLDIIKLFDLEAASDFILMAATLMRIKSQMLLPRTEIEEEEEEELDPRQELVHRLLEYKRFKDVAVQFADYEEESRKLYGRGKLKIEEGVLEPEVPSDQASIFDLISAFQGLLKSKQPTVVHRVQEVTVSLEERIDLIKEVIQQRGEIRFEEFFEAKDTKMVWIVTFIALLELLKRHVIQAYQPDPFASITIRRVDGQN
jgi:segregation and condensation protein A